MKFEIKHRNTHQILFEADIDCEEDTDYEIKLSLALCQAIRQGADVRGANLDGANLKDATLPVST